MVCMVHPDCAIHLLCLLPFHPVTHPHPHLHQPPYHRPRQLFFQRFVLIQSLIQVAGIALPMTLATLLPFNYRPRQNSLLFIQMEVVIGMVQHLQLRAIQGLIRLVLEAIASKKGILIVARFAIIPTPIPLISIGIMLPLT